MIVTEIMSDGRIHTYSDAGFMIRQEETGFLYEDAIDVIEREYTETDIPVPEHVYPMIY